jgi:hypothetical protein
MQPQPMPQPLPQPEPRHGRKPVNVYSEYTREAWRVFRPIKAIRFMVALAAVVVIGGAVAFWLFIGAPTALQDVEFLKPILSAE